MPDSPDDTSKTPASTSAPDTATVIVPDTDGINAVFVGGYSYDSVKGKIQVPAERLQSFLRSVPGAHQKG